MPSYYKVLALLESVSGLPEDIAVNTFHFRSTLSAATEAEAAEIMGQINTFYQDVANMFSDQTLTGVVDFKAYDMTMVPESPPIATLTGGFTSSGTGSLPREMCVCLSYRNLSGVSLPPARRRGRIFLGPLAATVGDLDGDDIRVTSATRTMIAAAANDLAQVVPSTSAAKWHIYSPTEDVTSSLETSFTEVEEGYIDNAFDVQRRRGTLASARTSWTD